MILHLGLATNISPISNRTSYSQETQPALAPLRRPVRIPLAPHSGAVSLQRSVAGIQTTPTMVMAILEAIGFQVRPSSFHGNHLRFGPHPSATVPSLPPFVPVHHTYLSPVSNHSPALALHQVTTRESGTTASKSTAFLHRPVHPMPQALSVPRVVP